MEQIFEVLKGIIVRALPTFFIVILLHWFLKKVLFQPLERVLEERREKTQGAIEASEATLALVNEKLAGYEQALGDARAAIYREQEAGRKKLLDQQAQSVAGAKVRASERVAVIKADITAQMEKATSALAADSERLAEQIAGMVIAGKVQ